MSNLQQTENIKISQYLAMPTMKKHLDGVLGERSERFVTNLVSLTSQNPGLSECTNSSVVSGAIVATSLNLSLNKSFGYAYLVPFKNRKENVTEAQFQIGYKGYIQLAMRSGEYRRLNAIPVKENQFVSWNPLTEEIKLQNETDGEGQTVGYVVYFELLNGFTKMMYWTYEKMIKHADTYSMAFNSAMYEKLQNGEIPQKELWKYSSFWYKNFDDMALKTMLRQILSKYGVLSEEMIHAYEKDQAVIDDNGDANYIDNQSTESKQTSLPDRTNGLGDEEAKQKEPIEIIIE